MKQCRWCRVTGVATAALLSAFSGPALAQSNEELMRIIREQQRQIEELSRKVDALTGPTEAASQRAEQTGEEAEAAVETAQKVEQEAPDIKVKWAPGPTFSSKDGGWSVHVRGRLMVDGGALGDEDDRYENDNAVELRAARLGIEGDFLQGWSYKFETDFADGGVDVKDAYTEYDGALVDPAYVRVGQYKTPNSLEELTGRRFITLLERSAIVDAFQVDRHALRRHDQLPATPSRQPDRDADGQYVDLEAHALGHYSAASGKGTPTCSPRETWVPPGRDCIPARERPSIGFLGTPSTMTMQRSLRCI